MVIRFFDPRPAARPAPGSRTFVASRRERRTVGLLANGFPDSMAFLDAVAHTLAHAYPATRFVRVEKTSPPEPLTDEQLQVLTNDCDGVIAAYGH